MCMKRFQIFPLPALLGLLGLCLAALPARAQFPATYSFTNDFNGSLPTNATLIGSAVVNAGYLKLTPATPGQSGSAIIDGLPSAQGVVSFRANFKAAVFGGSSTPADGYSFNLVSTGLTPPDAAPGENGMTNGLAISFDTFNNGGE